MGYRSEVHIAVPKRDEKKLDAIMNKHNLLEGDYPPFTKDAYTQKWSNYNENDDLVEEASEYIIYQGNHLKWYEGYKDVDEINSFIDDMAYDCCADDEFNVFGRMMVCIGEDNAIHGEIGDYFDIFNINMVVELQ